MWTSSSDPFRIFSNEIEEVISQGNKAFARLTYRGTHQGGLFGIAPTRRRIEYAGAAVFKFRGDKIAEYGYLITSMERHPMFPNRTNVQFAQVLSGSCTRIRIWERGAGHIGLWQ
jgi:hypothetical protein